MLYEGIKVLKTAMTTAALAVTVMATAQAAEVKGGIVDTTTSLNFRSAPSQSASIIDSLYDGYRVCILGVENGWASITCNGNPGYVSAEYLDVLDVMD